MVIIIISTKHNKTILYVKLTLTVISSQNRKVESLPGYKNPCWKEPFPQKNPYLGNQYRYPTRDWRVGDIGIGRLTKNWKKHIAAKTKWRIRCLPYFYVAGVLKCGTTDIFASLQQHPQVTRPLIKEPMWWARGRWQHGTCVFLAEAVIWIQRLLSYTTMPRQKTKQNNALASISLLKCL